MLHIIGQMRSMFMASVVGYFGEKLTPWIDANKDGKFDLQDFNKFDWDTQAAIRRVLGKTNMKTIESGQRFKIVDLIEKGFIVEREAVKTESRKSRNDVDPLSGTQFLADAYAGKTTEGNETNNTGGFTRTLKKGMSGQDVVLLQQSLTALGFNTNGIDGSFGPGTEKALKAYQTSIGAKADGVMTFGKKTMQSLLGVSGAETTTKTAASTEAVQTVETQGSDFQWLFDYIGATNTDIIPLELRQKITTTLQGKDGGGREAINALFENEVLPRLMAAQEIPTKEKKKIQRISGMGTNWKVRRDFLNELSSVLMGGKNINESARGKKGVSEYTRSLQSAKAEVFDILNKNEGLSGNFVSQTADAVKRAEAKIASLKDGVNKVSFAAVGMPTLTVRSQGNNNQLEAKEAGNMQVLTIDGEVAVWDMGEISLADKIALINNLGYTVKDLGISGVKTPEQLIPLVEAGKVEIDFDMILARNCGNISYLPRVTKKPTITTPTTPSEGSDGDGGGADTTTGGEWVETDEEASNDTAEDDSNTSTTDSDDNGPPKV